MHTKHKWITIPRRGTRCRLCGKRKPNTSNFSGAHRAFHEGDPSQCPGLECGFHATIPAGLAPRGTGL